MDGNKVLENAGMDFIRYSIEHPEVLNRKGKSKRLIKKFIKINSNKVKNK